jgi:hypothetical protein
MDVISGSAVSIRYPLGAHCQRLEPPLRCSRQPQQFGFKAEHQPLEIWRFRKNRTDFAAVPARTFQGRI